MGTDFLLVGITILIVVADDHGGDEDADNASLAPRQITTYCVIEDF